MSGPIAAQWQHKVLQLTDSQCNALGTYPPLKSMLKQGLTHWWSSPETSSMEQCGYPRELWLLIHQQNNIGWRQLFHSWFSQEWSRLQQLYYISSTNESRSGQKSGEHWQQQIILLLWDQWFDLWKQRSGDVLGSDKKTRHAADVVETQQQLEAI
jgi:hypothetical protein